MQQYIDNELFMMRLMGYWAVVCKFRRQTNDGLDFVKWHLQHMKSLDKMRE